ncbi:hypothetical protein V8G54_028206, partial [Vigna mungo]
ASSREWLLAEKILHINLLHLPIHIVQEHVHHAGGLPVSRHHHRREDRRHVSWRIREVPFRPSIMIRSHSVEYTLSGRFWSASLHRSLPRSVALVGEQAGSER